LIEERDLDAAVSAGVIGAATRERLVIFIRDLRRGAAGEDEESFRLLTGFNDIFVAIAIGLLLVAVAGIVGSISAVGAALAVAALSWLLAEYFTRRRRMALPSVLLLLSFAGAAFMAALAGLGGPERLQPGGTGRTGAADRNDPGGCGRGSGRCRHPALAAVPRADHGSGRCCCPVAHRDQPGGRRDGAGLCAGRHQHHCAGSVRVRDWRVHAGHVV
jgi:hypothetical protein